ncbi:hypothetical protein ACROYT_G042938 [Oculina patagonica]
MKTRCDDAKSILEESSKEPDESEALKKENKQLKQRLEQKISALKEKDQKVNTLKAKFKRLQQVKRNDDKISLKRKLSLQRHPCIVQFLAVADHQCNNPWLVMEFLEKSLPQLARQEKSLNSRITKTIGHDVACSLNYLHCQHPVAILHRDVSSDNVLVWREGDNWRGKLCDFGSAQFSNQEMSVNPGNPFFSAPEANTPNQSPKLPTTELTVEVHRLQLQAKSSAS